MLVDLERLKQPCPCGRAHSIQVKTLLIERGALNKLPEVAADCGLSGTACIICDENTYEAAGKRVEQLIPDHVTVILPAKDLHPNEAAIEAVLSKFGGCSYVISVGSGTLTDLGKYIATKQGVAEIAVATAASVDGFVSTVSAMTLKSFKITKPVRSPIAVIADTDIFSKAPYRLTASGVSDMLGKYTALADWRIAHYIAGEYLCETIYSIEKDAVEQVTASIDAIRKGEPKAYEALMYGLILSGLAMQMLMNSRPASGCEHHLSHLWELNVINPSHEGLHGEMVGVGLCQAVKVYKDFALEHEDIAPLLKPYDGLDFMFLQKHLKHLADEAIAQNTPDNMRSVTADAVRIHWQDIRAVIDGIPSYQEILDMLHRSGAPYDMRQVGLDPEILPLSLKLSPFIRGRITFMRVLDTMIRE